VTFARRLALLEALVEETPVALSPQEEALMVDGLRRLAAGKRPLAKQNAALAAWAVQPHAETGGPFAKLTLDELRVLARDDTVRT
jgi:hypothetical protein